jgi:uncharacterized protein (DUF2225 family)
LIDISVIKDFSCVKKYSKGSALVQAGDESCTMFIILKGSVCTTMANTASGPAGKKEQKDNNSSDTMVIIRPGGRFGEEALFFGKKPTAAAIALEEVVALPLSIDMIHKFIKKEPELAFEIMKDLARGSSHEVYEVDTAKIETPAPPRRTTKRKAEPAEPAAEAPAQETGSGVSSLFPEGHGSYALNLDSQNRELLMEKKHVCPLCKNRFTATAVRFSKLKAEYTDRNLRTYYKGVEPLYFDIVTCTKCFYSALPEAFDTPDKTKKPPKILENYKNGLSSVLDSSNIDSVFARHYLAVACAPLCFRKHHLMVAKLLMKLRRIYHDCEDGAMEKKLAKQSLDAYMYVYQNVNTDPGLDQQLCLIIGELCFFLEDYTTARKFLFMAKTNKAGSPALKRQAEDLIEDVLSATGKR